MSSHAEALVILKLLYSVTIPWSLNESNYIYVSLKKYIFFKMKNMIKTIVRSNMLWNQHCHVSMFDFQHTIKEFERISIRSFTLWPNILNDKVDTVDDWLHWISIFKFWGNQIFEKGYKFQEPEPKGFRQLSSLSIEKTVMKHSINKDQVVLFLKFYAHRKLDSNLLIFEHWNVSES